MFLLLLPLALAEITVSLDQTYVAGQQVQIEGMCTPSKSVGLEIDYQGLGVENWFDQVKSSTSGNFFSTYVPPADGDYTLFVACGAEQQTFPICVGSSCTPISSAVTCGDGTCNGDEDSSSCPADCGTPTNGNGGSGSSSGGGSGGNLCLRNWDCEPWSYCNNQLQQTRSCIDLNNCDNRAPTKLENRSCAVCEQSWVCQGWSDCTNGVQTRTCTDTHQCGSTTQKPVESRSCSGTTVVQTGGYPYQPASGSTAAETSFWSRFGMWLIFGLLLLILLVLLILLILHYAKKKHIVYNHAELVDWIRKEKAMGTSNDDIEEILADRTGWNEQEVKDAFEELQNNTKKPSTSKQNQQ